VHRRAGGGCWCVAVVVGKGRVGTALHERDDAVGVLARDLRRPSDQEANANAGTRGRAA
jgi:hypothetical protein